MVVRRFGPVRFHRASQLTSFPLLAVLKQTWTYAK